MRTPDFRYTFLGLIAAALLLAACGSVRLPQSPLLAQFERKSGRIAFVGLDGNIYSMNQAGEDLVAITDDAAAENSSEGAQTYFYPVWSPDRDQLAFVGFHQPVGGTFEAALYTANGDGTDVMEVYRSGTAAPFYVYWNPTGERITFLSSGGTASSMQLQMVRVDGGEAEVVETAQPFYWAWSPNGESFVAHTGGPVQLNPDGARMWRYDVETKQVEPLLMAPSFFQAPAFSPDGGYFVVALHDNRSDEDALVLVTADGAMQTELVALEARVAFDWAPEGNRLAYITGDSTELGLVGKLTVLDLRNIEAPEAIETDADGVMAFFWSPDGDRLAYYAPAFIEDEQGNQSLVFRLSVMNARNGESELLATIRPPESFVRQIVPFYDQYQRSTTIWSPDGRNLVVNALTQDNRPGIFVLPADGSLEPRFVEFGTMAFWSWK